MSAETYCNQCEGDLDDTYSALICICLQTGTLTRDDAADHGFDGWYESNDDAARACDRQAALLDSTTDDTDAECKATLDWMNKWPDEICPVPVSGDDDDDDDSAF